MHSMFLNEQSGQIAGGPEPASEPVAVEPVTAISSSWIIEAGTKALMPRGSGSALCSSTSLSTVAQGMYYSTL